MQTRRLQIPVFLFIAKVQNYKSTCCNVNGNKDVLKHWNLLSKEINFSPSQLCTEQGHGHHKQPSILSCTGRAGYPQNSRAWTGVREKRIFLGR